MNNWNKGHRFGVHIILALAMVAVLLGGCGGNGDGNNGVGPQDGMISEITMTVAVDENGQPLYPATVFHNDTEVFFCSFKVTDAPPDTKIKGELTYVSGEAEEQIGRNYVMDEMTITVEGTRYAAVVYHHPPLPTYRWPKGEYKVVLYVDEKEEASAPFTVK